VWRVYQPATRISGTDRGKEEETVDKEELKKKIYDTIAASEGKKKLKPGDVQKMFAVGDVTRDDVKKAIRDLVDSGTLTYAYLGGSYLVLPPKE